MRIVISDSASLYLKLYQTIPNSLLGKQEHNDQPDHILKSSIASRATFWDLLTVSLEYSMPDLQLKMCLLKRSVCVWLMAYSITGLFMPVCFHPLVLELWCCVLRLSLCLAFFQLLAPLPLLPLSPHPLPLPPSPPFPLPLPPSSPSPQHPTQACPWSHAVKCGHLSLGSDLPLRVSACLCAVSVDVCCPAHRWGYLKVMVCVQSLRWGKQLRLMVLFTHLVLLGKYHVMLLWACWWLTCGVMLTSLSFYRCLLHCCDLLKSGVNFCFFVKQ